ncbi:flotillin family protein [Paracoccus sp. IB05]|uniref:flotillin family protein n=1 Tax=Paracoccus sp. IB05 TaxID=2779367 RepID=UPI0018E7C166|nr:flotillin domain-containing protein [Paracoccus sp. IB05]MBJ2151655.1 flotillin [Paracoccus sp. IB05]
MNAYLALLIPGAVVLLALVVLGLIMVRLYRRSTQEMALVRTGAGGLKVVMGGGIIVLPGLHDLLRVNMKTMTITVDGGDGLITKDSRRVDAAAQFFIRVAPDTDAIARAAQSLGQNTNDLGAIRSLLEGKVQDTMRAITAGMDLIELHQSRASFVQKVQQTLNNDLSPNGLELESVALTKLDETPISKLDENNTFDVTGMRARAAIVSEQKKQRVVIEEAAALEIARTQQSNRIQKLEVERVEAEATQVQRIAVTEMEARSAREQARIAEETERLKEVARIERERGVRTAQIEQDLALQIAVQESKASVALQSEKQSRAEAQAALARAESITAEEAINTARLTAIAEREKAIEILDAEKEAEKSATSVRVRARVEREAAEDQAQAIIARARAEADSIKIAADAEREKGEAEAATIRAKVEAENSLSPDVMNFKLRLAKIEALPAIIREMAEPARHIQSFRINQITGMSGNGATTAGSAPEGGDGIVDQVMAGMQRNAVAMPILTALGKEVGIDFTRGMEGIAAAVSGASDETTEN